MSLFTSTRSHRKVNPVVHSKQSPYGAVTGFAEPQ